MNENHYLEVFKLLLDFIESNKWALIILTFLVFSRNHIGPFMQRMTRFAMSWKAGSGGLEVSADPAGNRADNETHTALEGYQEPSAENIESRDSNSEENRLQQSPPAPNKHWLSEVIDKLKEGREEEAERAFHAGKTKSSDRTTHSMEEAIYQHARFVHGNRSDAKQILIGRSNSAASGEEKFNYLIWLDKLYQRISAFNDSENLWVEFINSSEDTTLIDKASIKLSEVYRETGNLQKAKKVLFERILGRGYEDCPAIYEEIARLCVIEKDHECAATSFEISLASNEDNKELLFSAAYQQSESNIQILSFLNYQTLLRLDPNNSSALNNIAISEGDLGLPGKKYEKFVRAEEEGSTLATANIAQLMINVGMFDEAERKLRWAMAQENAHENVGEVYSKLEKEREREREKAEKLSQFGRKKRGEFRKYGNHRLGFEDNENAFLNITKGPNNEAVETKVDEGIINSKWLERAPGVLDSEEEYEVTVTGKIIGRSAKVIYNKKRKGTFHGLSLGNKESFSAFSYVDSASGEWIIFSLDSEKDKEIILT
ncbi:hypothetical protein SAMN05660831_01356 [Thiohalospira halophila DSM 15071]|uniref:Tetratricopeptide repeat-containing protein n=1 Tax=Thiohalospira halophila DSM 15071 TaxID=1123397 RepID=A0A1I1QXG8_9GAMM|nr:hypothetical protein [Thiohalospira halophila]SFD26824.1 hypothetical protein SAMN05660831_01356 [Thiohalospira halophila DSM 15071]